MRRKQIHRTSRNGIALLAALLAVVVVAVAITALAGHVSDEARRSMDSSADAQLEQMLMAGASDAQLHLAGSALTIGQTWETDLPPSLAEQGGAIRTSVSSAAENGPVVLHVAARLQRRNASQIVRFERVQNAWKLISAQIDG